MFGVSGDNIHLIDRIDRPDMIDAIKAGFQRKRIFQAILDFWNSNNKGNRQKGFPLAT